MTTKVVRLGNSWQKTAQYWKDTADVSGNRIQALEELLRTPPAVAARDARKIRQKALDRELGFRATRAGDQSEGIIVAGAKIFERFLRGEA